MRHPLLWAYVSTKHRLEDAVHSMSRKLSIPIACALLWIGLGMPTSRREELDSEIEAVSPN